YALLYNTLPGLRFFRGQERAAFMWAGALALLAGLGLSALPLLTHTLAVRSLRRALWAAAAIALIALAFVFAGWLGAPEAYAQALPAVAYGAAMVVTAALLLPWLAQRPRKWWAFALVPALAAFELFVVSMDASTTYDPVPPAGQLAMSAEDNRLLAPLLADESIFRVDGQRGLTDNYGSLWRLQDIHGISPLFLASVRDLIDGDLPVPRLWEVTAVKVVLSDWAELPAPAEITAVGADRYGPVNAHELTDPRPFALLMPNYRVAASVDEAHALLADPAINLRDTLILEQEPRLTDTPGAGSVEVLRFAPEYVELSVSVDAPALLSVALVDYPGWAATINGEPAEILRAYTAFSAVVVPAGDHTVAFTFQPQSVLIGATVSLVTWIAVLLLTTAAFILHGRRHGQR
ncbi:MAG TPA: YfhO family protein, partial [Candidatus Limnocylindrales bacterium]|nr:YfhO family protein [Candidatus Limnocylindrales bacterium]